MRFQPGNKLYLIIIINCGLFLLLSTLAMLFYPGGTIIDHKGSGYDFLRNFFSDTGRTKAYNGQNNLLSMILFSTALITVSLSIIPFFFYYPAEFELSQEDNHLKRRIRYIGTLAALCFIGIALTPWDILPLGHNSFVVGGYSLTVYATYLLYKIMFISDSTQTFEILITRVFLYIVGVYMVCLVTLPILLFKQLDLVLILNVVAQKVVVYAEILYYMALASRQYLFGTA